MNLCSRLFLLLLSISIFSCSKKETPNPTDGDVSTDTTELPEAENPVQKILKPKGVFASSGSNSNHVLDHNEVRGVLVRGLWKDIEPSEGNFDFTALDQQINAIKAKGKKYSLAVIAGGIGSPDWLITQKNVPYFNYLFRGTNSNKLPLIWDDTVLMYLGKLADKLAEKYNTDSSLVLVYIPQMTANGIEGHLNGFDKEDFENAGYTETKWINASLQNAKKFANVFPQKALAFEVHDLFLSIAPASTIITELWEDTSLNHRVGAAMWWISGNNTYQPNLIQFLEEFTGDIYCQVIQRSDKTNSFPNDDYSKVFEQAKQIKARYIEPWEYEFTINEWDTTFQNFNTYADTLD